MISLKRVLKPIRIAVPCLLALSATAAWTPTVTTSSTGFGASVDTSTTASIFVEYFYPGHPQSVRFLAKWQDSSNVWHTVVDQWFLTDNLNMTYDNLTHPPIKTAYANATNGGAGTGYGSIWWD